MKNSIKLFLTLLIAIIITTPIDAKTLEASATFTWDKLSQTERNADIQNIKDKLFSKNIIKKYDKKEFREKNNKLLKDANFKNNILYIKTKSSPDKNKIIVPFYFKNLLYGYGIIYKNDLTHCYYYDALGSLILVEIFDKNYNDYPNISYQYDKNGKLQFAVWALSDVDEYIYNAKGKFLGRWYKENYYNINGKPVLRRNLNYLQ